MTEYRIITHTGLLLLLCLLIVSPTLAQDTAASNPDDLATQGREVFLSHGCIACHGIDAQGSQLAPSLDGHSEGVIRRQIRAPLGIMPNFPPDKISSEELDALVAYLLTLEPPEASIFDRELQGPELGQEVVMQHWMTLTALEVEDIDEARVHVEYIMTLVKSAHRKHMQQVLDALDKGEVHEAKHIVESMLADISGVEDATAVLHLQLLLSAVRVEDIAESQHHLEHYRETEGVDEVIAATLETLLAETNFAEVEALLEAVLEAKGVEEGVVGEVEHDEHDQATESHTHADKPTDDTGVDASD